MPDQFQIESNVPIPKSQRGKYPWRKMKVGDSFFVPFDQTDDDAYKKVKSAAINFSKHNPEYCFRVRKQQDGVRVWRVEDDDGTRST